MKSANKQELLTTLEKRVDIHLSDTINNFQNLNEDILNHFNRCLDHCSVSGSFEQSWTLLSA